MDPTPPPRLTTTSYARLRDSAAGLMRRQRLDHTLQATALVHEAWAKAIPKGSGQRISAEHLHWRCVRAMPSVLIDHSRAKDRDKRLPEERRVPLEDPFAAFDDDPPREIVEHALERLARIDPEMARAIRRLHLDGDSSAQVADEMGISRDALSRKVRASLAWLRPQVRQLLRGASSR